MKHSLITTLILSLGLVAATTANAALVSRLGGQAVYDTDLNITWLADANYAMTSGDDADGLMTWSEAMTWAGNLSYGGYSDWRLPTTLQPDVTCELNTVAGSSGANCTGSEMGHLFYTELGGVANASILTSSDPDLTLYQNVQSNFYWSGTEFAFDTSSAWGFYFNSGGQESHNKNNIHYAWAVRGGDVAAVPVPAAAWLFGSGLIGLAAIVRRKKA